MVWTDHRILAPYDHILGQLVAEIHLSVRGADTHETRRRSVYAKQVIDRFADEITKFKGDPSRFYSTVLTPLLVRWLRGLHDAYSKVALAVIARGADEATMEQATAFYLTMNPTDPKYIRLYRRQLLNLPIARWYLATVLNVVPAGYTAAEHYHRFQKDHNAIMFSNANRSTAYRTLDEYGIPHLNKTEAAVLIATRLEVFFRPELQRAVRSSPSLSLQCYQTHLSNYRPLTGVLLIVDTRCTSHWISPHRSALIRLRI